MTNIRIPRCLPSIISGTPRSLLFSAADAEQWKDKTSDTFVREPSFAIRTAFYADDRPVAEYVAELGVNALAARWAFRPVALLFCHSNSSSNRTLFPTRIPVASQGNDTEG